MEPNFPGEVSFFSNIFFTWFSRHIDAGQERVLTLDDTIALPPRSKAASVQEDFELELCKLVNEKGKKVDASLLWSAFHRIVFYNFWVGGFCRLMNDLLVLTGPILIRQMIISAEQGDQLALLRHTCMIFATTLGQAVFLQQFINYCFNCGQKVTTAATSAVFISALSLKFHLSVPKRTIGEIYNLQSKDAASLREFVVFAHNLWAAPLLAFGAVVLLLRILGVAGIVSVVMLCGLLPLESMISKQARRCRKNVTSFSDARMSLIHDAIDGIRTLKLTNMCQVIYNRISQCREDELSAAWKGMRLDILNSVLIQSTTIMTSLCTFYVYGLIYSFDSLTADKIFSALAVINILSRPIYIIPKCVSLLSECFVSLERLASIISTDPRFQMVDASPESSVNIARVTQLPSSEHSRIIIKNASISWDPQNSGANQSQMRDGFGLVDVNLSLCSPCLVGVVGSNSSGKSTLFASLLGELSIGNSRSTDGKLQVGGSITVATRAGLIAYCGHDPWILNGTILYNILIGNATFSPEIIHPTICMSHLSAQQREEVIEIVRRCCLEEDLVLWPSGINTVLGEKGINVSGGQKARISLARALFSNASVMLLDSPMAGLDVTVASSVFRNAIKRASETALVLLITHDLNLLSTCDRVLCLKNKTIAYDGSFDTFEKSALADSFSTKSSHIDTGNNDCINLESESGVRLDALAAKKVNDTTQNMLVSAPKQSNSNVDVSSAGVQSIDTYLGYARACGTLLCVLAMLLSVMAYAMTAFTDVILALWADSRGEQNSPDFVFLSMQWYAVSTSLVVTMNSVRYAAYTYIGLKGSKSLHEGLVRAMFNARFSFFDNTPSGRIYSRFSSDFEAIDFQIPGGVVSAIDAILGVASSIVLMCAFAPVLLIPLVPLGYMYWAVQKKYRNVSRELKRVDSGAKSPIFSHFREVLSGLEYVRGYRIQSEMTSRHFTLMDGSIRARLNWDACNRWLGIRIDVIGALIISSSALFIAVSGVSFAGGVAGIIMSYALKATNSLSFAIRSTTALENMFMAPERVLQYSSIEGESILSETSASHNKQNINVLTWISELVEGHASSNTKYSTLSSDDIDAEVQLGDVVPTKRVGACVPALRLHDLRASYGIDKDAPDILHGINLSLYPGQLIGICGRTGSGKSTLVTAIARALDSSRYEIDTAIELFGKPADQIPLLDYRARVQVYPQDYHILSGSIREAIDPYECHTDVELYDALNEFSLLCGGTDTTEARGQESKSSSQSLGSIMNLSDHITVGGGNLSSGQKQIVAFVRAMLTEAEVIVLDEFNSNMDLVVSEKAFAILKMELIKKGKAVLMVCHRLEVSLFLFPSSYLASNNLAFANCIILENKDIHCCDELLVMDQGLIKERGSPRGLLNAVGGLFASMMKCRTNSRI